MDDNKSDNQQSDIQPNDLNNHSSNQATSCILPSGWIRLRHASGLPIYFHKDTRVVTFARPYALGSGSLRHHRIPLYAIPCLASRRESPDVASSTLSTDAKSHTQTEVDDESVSNGAPDDSSLNVSNSEFDREEGEVSSVGEDDEDDDAGEMVPDAKKPKLSTVDCVDVRVVTMHSATIQGKRKRRRRPLPSTNEQLSSSDLKEQLKVDEPEPIKSIDEVAGEETGASPQNLQPSYKEVEPNCLILTHDQVRSYCAALFDTRKVNRRPLQHKYKRESMDTHIQLPGTLDETKVIRYQIPPIEGDPTRQQPKEGLINMTGKSHVCILHEYCQNVLRRPPQYQTTVRDNDPNPYELTVVIDGQPYASGVGASKKQARLEAARQALARLIPDFDKVADTTGDGPTGNPSSTTQPTISEKDLILFDDIKLSDPRIPELSARISLPGPYNLLVECLNRSCIPESELKATMNTHGRTKHSFSLQLREHSVKVPCKNKREGRHLAAQLMFSRIHPELTSWGGVLRMYGPGSKPDKRGELETIQGAQSQEKSSIKTSLIRLLKTKMLELAEQWEKNDGSTHRKGKFFVPPDNLPVVTFHPDSKTNLYNSVPPSSSSPQGAE